MKTKYLIIPISAALLYGCAPTYKVIYKDTEVIIMQVGPVQQQKIRELTIEKQSNGTLDEIVKEIIEHIKKSAPPEDEAPKEFEKKSLNHSYSGYPKDVVERQFAWQQLIELAYRREKCVTELR